MLEYDPRLHITAGELRAMGAESLSSGIPNCAFTSRAEMEWGEAKLEPLDPKDPQLIRGTISLKTGAFHWIEIDVEIG